MNTDNLQEKATHPPNGILLAMVLLALGALLLYAPVRDFEFIHLGDAEEVANNCRIQSPTPKHFFWLFIPSPERAFQPLAEAGLMIDHFLFDLNPKAFHIHSLVLYVLNVLLVFLFGRFLLLRFKPSSGLSPTMAAFAAALLFLCHPVHVDSVAWVTRRPVLLQSAFSILAMLAMLKTGHPDPQGKPPSMLGRFVPLLPFIPAVLSGVSPLLLAVLLLLLDFCSSKHAGENFLSRKAVRHLPIFAIALSFALLFPEPASVFPFSIDASQAAGGATPALFGRYVTEFITALVFPVHVPAFPAMSPSRLSFGAASVCGWIAVLAFVIVLILLARKHRFLAFFLLGSALLSLLAGFDSWKRPQGQSHLFFAVFPFGLLLSLGAGRIALRSFHGEARARLLSADRLFLLAVAVSFAILSVLRLPIWKDDLSLAAHDLLQEPPGDFARYRAALTHARSDPAEGLRILEPLLKREDTHRLGAVRLAECDLILKRRGPEAALAAIEKTFEDGVFDVRLMKNAARIAMKLDREADAARWMTRLEENGKSGKTVESICDFWMEQAKNAFNREDYRLALKRLERCPAPEEHASTAILKIVCENLLHGHRLRIIRDLTRREWPPEAEPVLYETLSMVYAYERQFDPAKEAKFKQILAERRLAEKRCWKR